jgi:hypothetical protein
VCQGTDEVLQYCGRHSEAHPQNASGTPKVLTKITPLWTDRRSKTVKTR